MQLKIPHKIERDRPYLEDMRTIEDWRDRTLPDTAWNTYTPSVTGSTRNPTFGTGNSFTGRWQRIERLAFVTAYCALGTTGFANGSGVVRVSLPTQTVPVTTINKQPVGYGFIYNGSALRTVLAWLVGNTTYVQFVYDNSGGVGDVTYTAPLTFASGSLIQFALQFECAF